MNCLTGFSSSSPNSQELLQTFRIVILSYEIKVVLVKKHYELFGEYATRIAINAETLCDSTHVHCEGNPYLVDTPLKNTVSSVTIPDSAALDILYRDEKGQLAYETFVEERILSSSSTSIWDRMQQLKLKTHSTWMAKDSSGGRPGN